MALDDATIAAMVKDADYWLKTLGDRPIICDLGRYTKTLAAEVLRLRLELVGTEKARLLLLAGMESQAELMDRLKQESRQSRADLAAAQGVASGLADRVAAQSELLSQRAEKPLPPCGMRHHHPTCDCKGEGGER